MPWIQLLEIRSGPGVPGQSALIRINRKNELKFEMTNPPKNVVDKNCGDASLRLIIRMHAYWNLVGIRLGE